MATLRPHGCGRCHVAPCCLLGGAAESVTLETSLKEHLQLGAVIRRKCMQVYGPSPASA